MSIGLTKATNGYFIPKSAGVSLDSSREINPYNIVCYNWNGTDNSTGRAASMPNNSIRTSGCNTANDQIAPENALRPKYYAIINGGGRGIQGNFDKGLNQITSDSNLPPTNPMALPEIQLPGAEPYSQFELTMPTRLIRGNTPRVAEHFGGLPAGNFGISLPGIIRKGGEHFQNSYVLADRSKNENFVNSYVLADKQEEYLNAYTAAANAAGKYPAEKFTPPFAPALSVQPPAEMFGFDKIKAILTGERYASNNQTKLDNARMSDAQKQALAGVI